MSDLISRKWLMECVDEGWIKFDTEKDKNTYVHLVRDIAPSAEPEPCDDPRADIYYLAEKIGIHRLYALVVELRGEPEPCKDAVSRQAAIDVIKALYEWHDTVTEDRAVDHIKKLPSVGLRMRGKWIKNDNGTYSCSVCKSWIPEEQHYYARYCLYCGADMREGKQDG